MFKNWFTKKSNKSVEEQINDILILKGYDKMELIVTTQPCRDHYSKIDIQHYEVKSGATYIAKFTLHPMIGCCGICVSTNSYVYTAARNKGLGTLLNQWRIELARDLGFVVLLCTDVEDNKPQQKILKKNKWQKLLSFRNVRTNNMVGIHVIPNTYKWGK